MIDPNGRILRELAAHLDDLGRVHGLVWRAPDGSIAAVYRKIHLFDVAVEAGPVDRESARVAPGDVDVAELHDAFTILEIAESEECGFFKKGEGHKALERGETKIGGKLPINTSGGLKCKGHPVGATGLSMIYELITQLRGEAGERQVKNAAVGLSHNVGGTGQVVAVHIFRRE